MLLLNVLLHHELATSDKGRLTRYELNAYPFEIIIGLQKYGFSLNWQTISVFFWIYPVDNEPQAICRKQRPTRQKKTAGNKPHTINATIHNRQLATCSP